VGAGRKTITAAGGVAGLLLGFGLVFLFATPASMNSACSDIAGKHAAQRDCVAADDTNHEQPRETTAHTEASDFGLFRGMTLEQAIRSVEQRG
jgi:hypothetical protein